MKIESLLQTSDKDMEKHQVQTNICKVLVLHHNVWSDFLNFKTIKMYALFNTFKT